jgi:GntR family transcriptional regulator
MPARRQTYVEIADDMEERIRLGEYPPGSTLPSRRELADIYLVSVSTIDRATSLLRDRGLTEGHPGVALYVARYIV